MSHLYCVECTAPTYTYRYESFVLCWLYSPNIYTQIWVICIVLSVLPQHIHTYMSHIDSTAPTYTHRYESFVLCWVYCPNIYIQIWVICIVLAVLPQHIHTNMSHLYCIDSTASTYTYIYESFVLYWLYCPNIYIQIWVICIVLTVLPQPIHTYMSHIDSTAPTYTYTYRYESFVLCWLIYVCICWGSTLNTIQMTHICMYMLGLYSQHNTNDSYLYVYVGTVYIYIYIYIYIYAWLNCPNIYIYT